MAQIEHAWQGKVWFTSREQVLEYLKLLQDADILYYGNLIRSLAEKPCSNEEFRKVKDAHVDAMNERARELQRMEKDLRKREEEIHRLTEQLKTKEELRAFLADMGGKILEKKKENEIEQVKLQYERKEMEMKGDLKGQKLMNEQINALNTKTVAEKVEEIDRLRKEKEDEVKRIRKEKDIEIKSAREEKDAEIKMLRKEKEDEVKRIRKEKDIVIKSAREEKDAEIKMLRKEKDDEVVRVTKEKQTELTELRQLVESMNAKIENFAGTQKSSANLGKQGENHLRDLLQGSGKFELVQEVSSGHRQGDLVLKLFSYPGKQIMVDCKNRESQVPIPDKERFLRDLDGNHSYYCGMIVSLKCAVDTNVSEFLIQMSKAGKPYLYINNFRSYPGAATLLYVACLSLLNNVEHHEDDAPFRNFISSHLLSLTTLLKTSTELKTKASKLEENARKILDDVEKISKDMSASPKPSSSTGANRSQADNGEHSGEKRARHV